MTNDEQFKKHLEERIKELEDLLIYIEEMFPPVRYDSDCLELETEIRRRIRKTLNRKEG